MSIKPLNTIPEMTHPLSKYWSAPDRSRISFTGDLYAVMSKRDFDMLLEFNLTNPTEVYEGKMWKREEGDKYYLLWFGHSNVVGCCSINSREIVTIEDVNSFVITGKKVTIELELLNGEIVWYIDNKEARVLSIKTEE